MKRGSIQKCKIIGVLKLTDHGENDDKIIAVSENSEMYRVNDILEMENEFNGLLDIVEIWFKNYKGQSLLKSKGYRNIIQLKGGILNYLKSITVDAVAGRDISNDQLRHLEGMRYLYFIIKKRIETHREN